MNTLFIVDDHAAIRTAYRQFFRSNHGISVVGEAKNSDEALEKIPARKPSVALIDISMQEMDGLELTRQLKSVLPQLKVLIISSRDRATWAKKSLEAGANGFLSKRRFEQDIVAAIDRVLEGHTFFNDHQFSVEITAP